MGRRNFITYFQWYVPSDSVNLSEALVTPQTLEHARMMSSPLARLILSLTAIWIVGSALDNTNCEQQNGSLFEDELS